MKRPTPEEVFGAYQEGLRKILTKDETLSTEDLQQYLQEAYQQDELARLWKRAVFTMLEKGDVCTFPEIYLRADNIVKNYKKRFVKEQ